MSRRQIIGFAAAACMACCIGPILGVLGAIAALGVLSSLFIGVGGLAIAAASIAAFTVVRRRSDSCATNHEPVAVELSRPAR